MNYRTEVYDANLMLVEYGLVKFTWGNVSGIDRANGRIYIKPSGVDYDILQEDEIVVVDLEGKVLKGKMKPSIDTPTHVELYKTFPNIGAIAHTHSVHATSFAQARQKIRAYGTTHADNFYGDILCTRTLTREEVEQDYEQNIGKVIAETMDGVDEDAMPGILVGGHGVFTWGSTPYLAVHNAVVIEEVAQMALYTQMINPVVASIDGYVLDKHYNRKHGAHATYGQDN